MKVTYRQTDQGSPPCMEGERRLLIYIDGKKVGQVRWTDLARSAKQARYRFYGFAKIGEEIKEFQVGGFNVECNEPEDVVAAIVGRINLFKVFSGKKPLAALKHCLEKP